VRKLDWSNLATVTKLFAWLIANTCNSEKWNDRGKLGGSLVRSTSESRRDAMIQRMMATVLTPSGRKLSLLAPAWRRSVNKQPEARISPLYDACNEQGGTPESRFLLTFATLSLTVLSYVTWWRIGKFKKGRSGERETIGVLLEFTQRTVTRLQTRSIGTNIARWRQQRRDIPRILRRREKERE